MERNGTDVISSSSLRKRHSFGEDDAWEDRLPEHQIRVWRAGSAAELPGQRLARKECFSFADAGNGKRIAMGGLGFTGEGGQEGGGQGKGEGGQEGQGQERQCQGQESLRV